ncbi:hypothetical protein KJ656_08175, partial [bacterium]|nr:hypothetical protein [bacterium]
FEAIRDKLAKLYNVATDNQRIDSVHIKSNMRKLGRIGIFVTSISKFLRNLKRSHRGRFDTIEKDLKIKYLSKQGKRSFSMIKPSDSHKTLSEVSNDLHCLVEQFKDCSDVTGMDSYKLLIRILNEQCNVTESMEAPRIEVKKPKDISSDSLQNPSGSRRMQLTVVTRDMVIPEVPVGKDGIWGGIHSIHQLPNAAKITIKSIFKCDYEFSITS